MIYKLEGKYYIKLSGYLIEVKPFLKNGMLDFESTQNKIEITQDLVYKSVSIDNIREELKNNKIEKQETTNGFDLKSKKVTERTHDKYKFNYKN